MIRHNLGLAGCLFREYVSLIQTDVHTMYIHVRETDLLDKWFPA